ncbi:hypothetical protein [Pseudomarimonas salicorniae]|uniref:MAPEG family protein n=1 Tax=Pseudomarimonas salicorniae TaxID=2933270 RepID=A0ABT0GG33_9GAMM|nr:hypothetical protein [Lysobacter sp. CAU 1642]MCK7593498.1 hypothetical protein [Lysobacter sp. CAU 1642]
MWWRLFANCQVLLLRLYAGPIDCRLLHQNSLEHMQDKRDTRATWPAIWAGPALLPLVAAVVIDAGDKQVLVWLAAITLSLPYLAGAMLAWRTWHSRAGSVVAGCAAAAFAYVTLILLAEILLG